jgi:pantetheine-phosphate adenylyltransferase
MGVYEKSNKHLVFTTEERVALAKKAVAHLPNVEVKSFGGLAVDFARQEKAKVMIRGLRMNADFEKEFEMAMMNRKLAPELDMLCLMASQEYQFLSSSLLKEVACLGGDISDLVPEHVAEALRRKVRKM